MAFEMKDHFKSYSKRGDDRVLWNVVREDSDNDGLKFYFYQTEEGNYLAQRVTTSGTLKIYQYYAAKNPLNLTTDFTNRTTLTYVEYYQLFNQGS